MTKRLETIAAQALGDIDEATGAIVPPIHLSTTFARDAAYGLRGPNYSRDDNPTFAHAERVLAALEGGTQALTFASGMAAATAILRAALRPGDRVVASRVGYFATRNWLSRFCARWGVELVLADLTDPGDAIAKPTRLVWAETPANPVWDVCDIAALAQQAHDAGALLAVDSTCATPVHTQPLALGADLVMHSATKYLAGHSDVLAGAAVRGADPRADEVWEELRTIRHDEGAVLGPFESFLLLRGMRTLFARVERQSAAAASIASRLEARGVRVRYPGLPSHPQHAVAAKQMRGGFGGMLSIQTGGGPARALEVLHRLKIWVPATSLGGVESLVEHRFSVEGAGTPTPPDLLRLSVGLEHVEDLYEDLAEALA